MISARPGAASHHLLLMHGMLGNPGQWRATALAAPAGWEVMCPVLPLLDLDAGCCAIGQLAERMVRLMDQRGVERVVAGGNSLGGHIAARMALDFSDRVAGVVLTGSSGLFERGFEKSVPRRPTEEYVRSRMSEVFYDPVHCTPELVADVRGVLSDLRRVMKMIRLASCAKRDNLRDRLPALTCPALLVWGREDLITPPGTAEEFAALLPDARLHWLERCGHVPMVEQPEVFHALLEDFLNQIAAKGPALLSPPPAVRPQLSAA
jgi:2-hydroxy-6-oxonona-2,4-dienedioate hydrolase